MGQMFLILLRILFPLDPVARFRELMRSWLGLVMSWVADPEELASYAYWPKDRAKLESCICFLEYAMQVLIHDRTRQMLGQRYVYMPLQDKPHIRHPKSLDQLLKRLAQLARDFHNLDALAARRAERMRREESLTPSLRDSSLRLDAPHRSTSPGFAGGAPATHTALEVLPRQRRGRWIGASSRRDGGGCVLARGCLRTRGPPPHHAITHCQLPTTSHSPARTHPVASTPNPAIVPP